MNVQQKIETTCNESRQVEPVAWISYESLGRLKNGGNSRGAVPVHTIQSHTAKIPLYTAPPQRPAEPVAWLRAIDEAMVVHDCGVADPSDDYETAKRKLNTLFCIVQDIGSYFAQPQRKPLTDEELDALAIDEDGLPNSHLEFARAIERAHGIGDAALGAVFHDYEVRAIDAP